MSRSIDLVVDDYMTPIIAVANEETPAIKIYNMMKTEHFRHVPVAQGEGKPVGIISDRDLMLFDWSESTTAAKIMTRDPYCVQTGTPIEEVAFQMSSKKIGCALVINSKGHLEGIFTSVDALNALVEVVRGDC